MQKKIPCEFESDVLLSVLCWEVNVEKIPCEFESDVLLSVHCVCDYGVCMLWVSTCFYETSNFLAYNVYLCYYDKYMLLTYYHVYIITKVFNCFSREKFTCYNV
jgi:hypothetical protein